MFTFFVLVATLVTASGHPLSGAEENFLLAVKSLKSAASALEFLDQWKHELNLDSLIGVRIFADQTEQLINLATLSRQQGVAFPLINSLIDLNQQAEDLMRESMNYIKSDDPGYFMRIGRILVRGLWSHWSDFWNKLEKTEDYVTSANYEALMSEERSDTCVGELINFQCRISESCWNTMTRSGYGDYQLSHQAGCAKEMDKFSLAYNGTTALGLRSTFCSKMYLINGQIAEDNFPQMKQDLFMENIAFCGILGYSDFMTDITWLQNILEWQNYDGCYGIDAQNILEDTSADGSPGHRVKRRERLLSSLGCMGHKTSMALGAIAANIRFLLSP